jgi:ribosome-associated translation inhibitor RaiA
MPHRPPGVTAIDVRIDADISPQTRSYAEYRVFAVLAKYAIRPQRVRVTLRTVAPPDACRFAECDATLEFAEREVVQITARGAHPYAAVNRAVDEIDLALRDLRTSGALAVSHAR